VSETSSAIEGASGTHFKDTSKPDGDACREDGTLKEASEIDWAHSPSAPNFREDSVLDGDTTAGPRHEDFLPSYLSNGKKRKHDSSDEESDIIMIDCNSHDKSTQRKRLASGNNSSDDEIEPRNNAAGSSSTTQRRQFHHKSEKRKKDDTDCDGNPDSGESEKEDVVMEDTKEDRNKVSLFSCLCNASWHVHAADIASLIGAG
jgi:hypothetical protein